MKKTADPIRTAKWLQILWWITFGIVGIASMVEKYGTIARMGSYVWSPFSNGFQLALVICVAVWFLPLMVVIRRHAKAGQMQKTHLYSTVLIVIMASWVIVGIFFPQLMQ